MTKQGDRLDQLGLAQFSRNQGQDTLSHFQNTRAVFPEIGHPDREATSPQVEAPVDPGQSQVADTTRSESTSTVLAQIARDIERPQPPFWGTKILQPTDISLDEVFGYLDLQALIVGQWQFRKPKGQSRAEYDQFLADQVYPILETWKQRIVTEDLLHPQVIYGYFPCQAEGNTLNLYSPDSYSARSLGAIGALAPIAQFEFPRQRSLRRLCIADFYAPKESGTIDVFPMQAVTVGSIATEYAQQLFAADQYTDYLYFHGLAVQTAEALAEWIHAHIRQELGFRDQEPDNIRDILAQRYQGSRYSFGYPACPNIQDQTTLLELLETHRIDLYMDESEQLYPEQSTTAIVAYHPAAKYFSA